MNHFKYHVKIADVVYQQSIMEELLRLHKFDGSDYIQPRTEATEEIQVGIGFSSQAEADEFKAKIERLNGVVSVVPEQMSDKIPEYKKL